MRRRADLALYQKSAALIENLVPMRTGGVRLRPGASAIADLTSLNAKRILPFVISVREHYIVVLSPLRLYIFGLGLSGTYENLSGDGFVTEYQENEIPEIQIAYNYDRVVLVQRNHPPFVIQKSTEGGWNAGNIVLDVTTDAFNYTYDDEGNETKSALQYDYKGLFTENNFPSVAAFFSSRLWLGAPTEYPYRIWASVPFEYTNFQTTEYYNALDESVTTDQYLDAIQGAGETLEDLGDGHCWEVTKSVDPNTGIVIVTSAVYDYEDGIKGQLVGHKEYNEEDNTWGPVVYDGASWSYSYKYTRAVRIVSDIPTESSALMLDMAGDKDETISWLAGCGNLIFVGTASSEWSMAAGINALAKSNSHLVSFGSAPFLQSCYGVKNIFYVQSGGKTLRTIYTGEDDAPMFRDLSFQCSDILAAGVKEMAWQRVPEPRLYCVLKDGTMAVLCYDMDYDISAWCKWTFSEKVKSISVIDTEDGQEVFILMEDEEGTLTLARLDNGVFTDIGVPFKGHLITNNLDSISSLSLTKKTYAVAVDSMSTRFKAGVVGTPLSASFDYESDLIKLNAWTRPSSSGLRYEFEGFEGEDMIILAIVIETEANN